MRNISEIIIHCTATRADWWQSRSTSQKVAEVRKWHVSDRGWSDIGYHYLIDRDGTVAEGRPLDRNGAHVRGHNSGTIGIALFGGHGGSENDVFLDNFTPEQEAALRGLIERLETQFGTLKLSGHNQYAAKACPCFRVPEWRARKPVRSSPAQSTTLRAAAGTAVAGAGGVFTALSRLDPAAQYIVLGFAAVALLGLGWIARERLRKWAGGDR
jgi:ribonuclease HI